MRYYRPIMQTDLVRPDGAVSLGEGWFTHVEEIWRGGGRIIAAVDAPQEWLDIVAKIEAKPTSLMGVLNVTPDSFSDGGLFDTPDAARAQALRMLAEGADILDIGGESTRPGADFVDVEHEIARTVPVISALCDADVTARISIDTRKAAVAEAALQAGASLVNDVTGLEYDAEMLAVVANSNADVCLMHSKGTPDVMQNDPRYGDVLLEVYDYLAARRDVCLAAGIALERIILDPGIGFGKTTEHNLALIRGLSLFHGLGCRLLLGVSRKSLIGNISGEKQADRRLPGSLAIALEGVRQGVQMLRVHDIAETKQALALWRSVH